MIEAVLYLVALSILAAAGVAVGLCILRHGKRAYHRACIRRFLNVLSAERHEAMKMRDFERCRRIGRSIRFYEGMLR